MKAAAVIAAGGKGVRMGGATRKQYLFLDGKPVLARSAALFLDHGAVDQVVLVVPAGDIESTAELLRPYCPSGSYKLVEGGATRQDSINNGLAALQPEADLICVHDAARPLASRDLLDSLLESALRYGAAVPVITLSDTAKEVDRAGFVVSTPPREALRLVQTPQVFRRDIITNAYRNAYRDGLAATDDAALVELSGNPVATVPGELSNLKITSPRDLDLASFWLEREKEEGI